MIRLCLLAGACLLAACESFDLSAFKESGNDGEVLVRSTPSGAFLSFSDGTICQTPCNVIVTGPLDLTIAAAGHAPLQTVIDADTPPTVDFTLSPVGRVEAAEDVEPPL